MEQNENGIHYTCVGCIDVDAGMNSHSEIVIYLSRTSSVDGRTERVGFTLLFLFTAEGSCYNCLVLGVPFSPCG